MARPPAVTRVLERAGVIGLTTILLLPLLPLVIWAFSQRWLYPAVLPTEWGLRAWRYILAPNTRALEALGNSLAVALLVTVLALLIALPAGRGLGLARSMAVHLLLNDVEGRIDYLERIDALRSTDLRQAAAANFSRNEYAVAAVVPKKK